MKNNDYINGFIAGLKEYAWWKDGVQYVGSCGTTLKDAIDRSFKEYEFENLEEKFRLENCKRNNMCTYRDKDGICRMSGYPYCLTHDAP